MIGKPKWPASEFNLYLEELMRARGIRNRAELSRLAGVSEQQLSQWRHGRNQPTTELLTRIAPTLDASVLALQIKAGLVEADGMESPPDTTVLPPEFSRALDAYTRATVDRPELVDELLRRVGEVAEWFEWKSSRRAKNAKK